MGFQLAFDDVKGGMNAADPPHRIATNQVASMVNCQLVDQLPTTRPGTRVVPLSGPASEFVAGSNNQGALFFNPAMGQGGIQLAQSNSHIAVAVGGRKFLTDIIGRRHATRGEISEITDAAETNRMLHLVYWGAWEDLLLANDGESAAFIWDGTTGEFSPGYNTINKTSSRVPNGGTCLGYAHTRGIVVSNSKAILASDSLHQTDQSTSANLRNFIDQVYWATGQYFLAPTLLGGITAIANLPQQSTQHGHGETFFHCPNGLFSIDFNIFPRSKWSETPMVKTAWGECGATGPYAVAVVNGDQIFRTRNGVQTLRSAAAAPQLEGAPATNISAPVDKWLRGDYATWLKFAAVVVWSSARRFFVTVQPIVQSRFRWHRGLLVKNTDPAISQAGTPAAWEGLWTFPAEFRGIVQPICGLFAEEERFFAWCRGDDGRNRLVEVDETLRNDILEDGTEMRIEAQVITRAVDASKWWESREYASGRLYLKDIEGTLDWGVWFRTKETPVWLPWRAGTVENPPNDGNLLDSLPRPQMIPLGDVPKTCNDGKSSSESCGMQFLVRWRGRCSFQGLRIELGERDLSSDDGKGDSFTFTPISETEYDDFGYDSQFNPWPLP